MQKSDYRNRIRRRAVADAFIVILLTFLVTIPVAEAHDSLLVGIAAASVGLLYFMVRRSTDFSHIAAAVREDARRLSGKGMSLSDWRDGKPLPPWAERMSEPVRQDSEPAR